MVEEILVFYIFRQVMDPAPLPYHQITDETLDEVKALYRNVHRDNRPVSAAGKENGSWNGNDPYKEGIEQESDPGLTSATQGEIGSILISVHRHKGGSYKDQHRCCRLNSS